MGWLGKNFWEIQPRRRVGCRVVESLEWASQASQLCVEFPEVFEEHPLQLGFPPVPFPAACVHPSSYPHPHTPIPIHVPGIPAGSPHPSAHRSCRSVPSGAGYNGQRLPWLGNGGAAAPVLSSPSKRQLYIKNEGKTIQIP